MKRSTRVTALAALIAVAIAVIAWLRRGDLESQLAAESVEASPRETLVGSNSDPDQALAGELPADAASTDRVAAKAENVATLRVLVQSLETGSPLCDVQVFALPGFDSRTGGRGEGSSRFFSEMAMTDAAGRAEMDVQSDVPVSVFTMVLQDQ